MFRTMQCDVVHLTMDYGVSEENVVSGLRICLACTPIEGKEE